MSKAATKNKPRKASRFAGFVADGFERLKESKWFKERQAAIDLEIRQRYAAELKSGDWWKKVEIEAKIQRDVQRELEKIYSPYSLWISS